MSTPPTTRKENKMKLFVEIGCADFSTCEPLLDTGWRGIFVEPVPRYAKHLREQTAGKDAVVIEAAVSDFDGEAPFLVSTALNNWVRGISHLDTPTHRGAKLLRLEANKDFLAEQITVQCMTLDTLLKDIRHVDFMKLDTEGHEINILHDYSWRVRPSFMKIEHKHIDDVLLRKILQEHGYMTWTEQDDIYAVC